MGISFTKESYQMQAKRRFEDPQVGYLLKDIHNMEQIIVTNLAQFRKFYRRYKGEDLTDDLTLEECNRLKVDLIKEIMMYMCEHIEGGVYFGTEI